MEQHPVPQQISSYRFKLVGDMTLKQFLEVASGVGVAIILYGLGLPGLIKWPLIIISVCIGGALAFIPFEERPLEQWIFAFFRSIYSPTLFYWKKSVPTDFFQAEGTTSISGTPTITDTQTPPGAKGEEPHNKLEATEKTFLSNVTNLLQTAPQTQPITEIQTPQIMVNEVKEPQQDVPVEKKEPEVKTIDVAIPTKPAITVDAQVSSQQTPMATQDIKPSDQAQTQSVELFTTKPTDENVQNAQFSQAAAPPSPPYTPNTLTGQVLDSTGKIVEGAILEIKDASGRPARAVRTNRAGHFLITIPFTNGTYEIVTEKDGLHFKSVKFEAKGEIIPAIIIKGEEEKSKEIYS